MIDKDGRINLTNHLCLTLLVSPEPANSEHHSVTGDHWHGRTATPVAINEKLVPFSNINISA